ncbi:universal stress protein [Pseudobacillus wudalianchiensis]|uniref:UspA domain-containing protein n=1 Tax=Pseudobacillus wudalianchiensis TaxID=1743143 RepID=A0A1B9B6Y9_9BACI|nr:universal stress protein [Bacillus wudalianchiensis]OCA91891.1 hypothetical protein A8F95_19400 [Bacillus wudalianchiensis]
MYKNILIYADNAEDALNAVKSVTNETPCPSIEMITFLYIFPVSHQLEEIIQEGIKLEEKLYANSSFVEEACRYLDKLEIKHQKLVRIGNPSQEIALITQSDRYDLLITAKAESKETLKSIAQKARCPVLILNKK